MKQILRQQGVVHDIQVVEQRGIRYLRFGDTGGWQGALRLSRKQTPVFPYQRAFAAVAPTLLPNAGSFLSFGVGTGTSLRTIQALHPGAELFGVELDERVLDIAVHYFEAPSHKDAVYWVGDGLDFIQRVPSTFDCVFLDAYLNNHIYTPVLDASVPGWLFRSLKPGGVVAANLIFRSPVHGQMKTFLAAAAEIFPHIYLLPVGTPGTEQNVLTLFSHDADFEEKFPILIRKCEWLNTVERLSWPRRFRRFSAQ